MTVPENLVSKEVIDAAIKVHRATGPGLYESAYIQALVLELEGRKHGVQREVHIPGEYRGMSLGLGYRVDLVVDGLVIVEVKSVAALSDVHRKQILTYVTMAQLRLGLLLNFNVVRLVDGVVRMARGLPEG